MPFVLKCFIYDFRCLSHGLLLSHRICLRATAGIQASADDRETYNDYLISYIFFNLDVEISATQTDFVNIVR